VPLNDAEPHRRTEASEDSESQGEGGAGAALLTMLDTLPEMDRTILLTWARSQDQGTWATELAAELHLPAGTIRSRKHRALEKLRRGWKDRSSIHRLEKPL
jgi:DNA-directed RNA polymerase specialized sigma24 family protein